MPEEMFDNEIDGEVEEGSEVIESEAEAEGTEEAEPKPEKHEPPKWVMRELQEARQAKQRAEQEAHALRMQAAQFQFQSQQQKKAVLDPEQDQLRQILKPILDAELEPERQRRLALEEAVKNYEQIAQVDTNIRIIQNELGDDYELGRKLMVPYLESRPERSRNALLENPDLFIEKAQELIEKSRSNGSKVAKAVLKSKMKHETGDSPKPKTDFDPSAASEKDFNAYLRSRGIL